VPTLIDTDFPGGRVGVLDVPDGDDPIQLEIQPDNASDMRQWFAFQVVGEEQRRDIVLGNASGSTFPNGWPGYRVMATLDGKRWFRARTQYDGESLVITHTPRAPIVKYAYFATYEYERLVRRLERVRRAPHADVMVVGQSVLGRDIHVARFGGGDRVVWILGRQHPGETPASFAMDGLLARLSRADDEATQELLESSTVFVAPLVDVDGAELGNMRTNAAGVNLNRAWDDPDPEDAPEVAALLEAIQGTGVDVFFDVHSDESSTYAFAACSEGNPSVTDEILEREAELCELLSEHTVEFLDEPFYDRDEPGAADLSCAANQVGERYGCPAITLELPMKDTGDERVPAGWSTPRAHQFGACLVDVLARF
jgi:murein tripeptide amidase MpaA